MHLLTGSNKDKIIFILKYIRVLVKTPSLKQHKFSVKHYFYSAIKTKINTSSLSYFITTNYCRHHSINPIKHSFFSEFDTEHPDIPLIKTP